MTAPPLMTEPLTGGAGTEDLSVVSWSPQAVVVQARQARQSGVVLIALSRVIIINEPHTAHRRRLTGKIITQLTISTLHLPLVTPSLPLP